MESIMHSKLFGCNIHDSIRVNPMALQIINTPEFQRMRCIKQLALCHHVYPSATHTRFEHSIGVYHLAGRMVDKIMINYPDKEYFIPEFEEKIKLTPLIAECIKIGALCHDIGHGPFSHIFDDYLLKGSTHENKDHEIRSCLIVEMLCKRVLFNELDDKHISFIKSIINPTDKHCGALYQIVSNNLNGIDVDKFDYLLRDTKNLGLSTSFNPNRLINEFIVDNDGNIAYPKHCYLDIYEMFHTRYLMHKKVYCHKTVKLVELMLGNIFVRVDNIFGISKSIDDMSKFCQLTDETIFHYIKMVITPLQIFSLSISENDLTQVVEAKDIYQSMLSRKLYQHILEITDSPHSLSYLEKFINDITDKYVNISKNDFDIIKTKIGFVSGNKSDPFDSIYFYDKKENGNTFLVKKNYISDLISNKIQETRWSLICKNRSISKIVFTEMEQYIKECIGFDELICNRKN